MRHPFWILNSSFLLLSLAAMGFIIFSQQTPPSREPIEPEATTKSLKMEASKINISKIYEDDLFGTYHKGLEVAGTDRMAPFPEPPHPMPTYIPEVPKPQFLEPLPITLRGIILVLNDDSKNRAIIADNRTNAEGSYRVGDHLEDAQLIRIFNNKVIFMRSNGQQEVLYLREKDAKIDPSFANIEGWEGVIQTVNSEKYLINAQEFTNRIQSLGQFIDMLDITTVYKQGEGVASRIGTNNSLSQALGLEKGDMITAINGKPATDTTNRLAIFKEITSLKTNDTITVTLIRDGQERTQEYTLQDIKHPHKKELGQPPAPTPETITPAQLQQLEKKHTFAPTLKDLRQREKTNMFEKGKRPSQNVLSNLTE